MIKESEYKRRRDSFAKKLAKNSLTLLFSAKQKARSNDTNYPYRQNSNFYYLTGFKEDNSSLVFIKTKKESKCLLFVQKKDKTDELWNGKRLGKLKAKKRFLVDSVKLSKDFKKSINEFSKDKKHLYYDFAQEDTIVKKVLTKNFITHGDISSIIGEMRLIKSVDEIKLIKKAISITKEAHHEAM
ncbi:MAG: aminopeptidase P N-terminal domain-containing protein, partial [Campylobacterota bacterium]|nr:aminopeptidase P N-terminal domain-containing protein [Campylobacterota bacterium]